MIAGSISFDERAGRWRARFRWNGKHRSWTPAEQPRNQKQADRLLADYLRELERGEEVTPAKDTFAAVADRWFKANRVNWSGNTPATYWSLLEARILPAVGAMRVQKMTAEELETWRDRWLAGGYDLNARLGSKSHKHEVKPADPLPRNTVARLMWLVDRVLDFAKQRGLVRRNVADLAVRPKEQHRERQVPRIEWCETVMIPALLARGRLGWPFVVLYETGLRSGELRALKKEDVDFAGRLLTVDASLYWGQDHQPRLKEPKNRSSKRLVPLTERALAVLRKQVALVDSKELRDEPRLWVDNGLLFPGRHGRPMRASTLLESWFELQAEMGVGREQRLSVHDLRHLASTAMERAGITDERRAKILGHAKVQITRGVYTHYDRAALAEVAATMDRSRRKTKTKMGATTA